MDMKTLTNDEAVTAVNAMVTVEELRAVAPQLGITYSGNTGINTLKTKILDHYMSKTPTSMAPLDSVFGGGDEPVQMPVLPPKKAGKLPIHRLLKMDSHNEPDVGIRRQIVRAKALQLIRCRIVNLDPNDIAVPGAIITVMNQYTGKVSKFVPYGDESENGYHLPKIIVDHLKGQKFSFRKEKKGAQFGVKQYKTTMVAKFNITELPPLTKIELEELAQAQRAGNSIDA